MSEKEQIVEAVYRAIDEVNQQRPEGQQLAKSPETVLSGESGVLDSLGLISVLVAAEEEIEREFGATVSLTEVMAGLSENHSDRSGPDHPLRTIATLVDHISELFTAKKNV